MQIVTGRSADLADDLRAGIGHARRAVDLDDRLELAQASLGVLLAMAGQERDAARVLRDARAMNPNNAILHFAQTHACLFQAAPDCDLMERPAEATIRLSPRDPLAWGFWLNLGNARILRSGDLCDPEMRAAFETAARLPNADFMAFLVLALHRLQDGDRDGAARNLRLAMDRNPRLSAASLPGVFRFPMWSQH